MLIDIFIIYSIFKIYENTNIKVLIYKFFKLKKNNRIHAMRDSVKKNKRII